MHSFVVNKKATFGMMMCMEMTMRNLLLRKEPISNN